TSKSRADIEDADRAPQDLGDGANHRVADQVPVRVVDGLEIVDVDHQQTDRQRMTLAALQFFLDARVKIPAIEQTTDGIDGGGLGERSRLHKRALPSERERE